MRKHLKEIKSEISKRIVRQGSDPYNLIIHIEEVEKWAKFLLKHFPSADSEVVMLSVWLHDIGHYPITKEDHAVRSVRIAKKLLNKWNYPEIKIKEILYCIRAHRCRDIFPESLEAKIIVFADSASHSTEVCYADMARVGDVKLALEKLEKDYNDLDIFPKIKKQIKPLYKSWRKLLENYEKLNIK